MKRIIILCLGLLFSACSQNISQETNNSPKITIETIQTADNKTENEVITIPTNLNLSAFPTPEKTDEDKKIFKELTWENEKSFGLSNLEKLQISKDDLELRVWQINDLYMRMYKGVGVKESVFILRRKNGNWSARVIRNTVESKSRIERQIKTKLNAPISGWEDVWQNLVNNELLTFPDATSKEVITEPDASIFIFESKINGAFKIYIYAGTQEIKEIKHTAKIANIIAKEFDLEDFQATRKYEE